MRRRALFASLSPLAIAGFVGLVALALDPETTMRLATQLAESILDTGRAVLSFLRRAAPAATVLFAALAWVVAGGFGVYFTGRDPADARVTAELAFALVFSAGVPLVVVFARDRPRVVAVVVVAALAAGGAVLAGRSDGTSAFAGLTYSFGPLLAGAGVGYLLAGAGVAQAATLALPVVAGYSLGMVTAAGRFKLAALVSAVAFAVPAWLYFPPAAEAARFHPGTVALAVGFALVAAALSLPFGVIGYAAATSRSDRTEPAASAGGESAES